MAITQQQYNVAKQVYRNVYIRVNLLNFDLLTISSFEGNLISGNLASDSNSSIRNTCSVELVVTDSTFNVQAAGKIWLDRLIQIYIGVDDIRTGETVWTNKGIYLINQPTYVYDAETNTMSFDGVDMMAMLTGLRKGNLDEVYLVQQGENVREVIIAILKLNGFTKYVVDECTNADGTIQPVPYDIQYTQDSTWYDVLEALMNILPNYQIYFDNDGIFHYEQIPYKPNETIMMSDDVWQDNVISESVSYDFESVKNSIKVLGRTHDISNYATEITVTGSTIALTIPSLETIADQSMIGFTTTSAVSGAVQINVNGTGDKPLVNANDTAVNELDADTYYVALYIENTASWEFIGHVQAEGEYKDTNPNSPFYIGNPAGEIKIVLSGGDYDNIMTDDLAYQRAKWEIYQRCRMNDTVQLTTVPIYWAEVNWMVTYTPLGGNIANQYIIKSVHTDLAPDGNQTYELAKYYPYYE